MNILRKIIRLSALSSILFLFTIYSIPIQAFAASTTTLSSSIPAQALALLQVEANGQDILLPTVPFDAGNGEIQCISSPFAPSDVEQLTSVQVFLYPWEYSCDVSFIGSPIYDSSYYCTLWSIDPSSSKFEQPLTFAPYDTNESYYLLYLTSDGTIMYNDSVTVDGTYDTAAGLFLFTNPYSTEEIIYPAALVSSRNELVGVALADKVGLSIYSEVSTIPSGNAGGSSSSSTGASSGIPTHQDEEDDILDELEIMWAPILVGSIIGLLIRSQLKKKKKSTDDSTSKNISSSGGTSNSYNSTNNNSDNSGSFLDSEYSETVPVTVPIKEPVKSRFWLAFTNGYMMGRLYPMDQNEISIGRSPSATIPYKDNSISKTHCKLYKDSHGDWLIVDLNSRNGTFIKRIGKLTPMQPVKLEEDDIIYLSSPKIAFQIRCENRADSPVL